ncbi:MAG: DNA polymerase IV [Spongiibacteraceae bacterium]
MYIQSESAMRKIIHCDCDCFYAAVEMRDDPTLREVPLAIGGAADRRGVVATCNYMAREFGVHSAMSTALAKRRCENLIVIPPNMEKYRQVAAQIHDIFTRYSSAIEPLSLDEAYLDVSDSLLQQGSATKIAQAIREDVQREVGITISAGVAPNKFLAKIASDWNKPDGLMVITPDLVESFVRDLPVRKIHGVGAVTAKRLAEKNIHLCADLQTWSEQELIADFGRFGGQLYHYARGIDSRPVQSHRDRKSLSVEETYAQDVEDFSELKTLLVELFDRLQLRLQARGIDGQQGVFLKLKGSDFTLSRVDRQCTRPLSEAVFEPLLLEAWQRMRQPVRLLGIGVRLGRASDQSSQLSLFAE